MTTSIVKLYSSGDLEEVSIYTPKTKTYSLDNFLEIINRTDEGLEELYQWDLEGSRKLILIGSKFQEGEENIHQLPINRQYQYYGDLFTLILLDHKYQDLSLESFENFWNALYLNMDEVVSQDELYSSDDNIEDQIAEEDEEIVLEDYGEESEEEIEEEEPEKKKKPIKRRKPKIVEEETKDVLFQELEIITLQNPNRIKCLDILCGILSNITKEQKVYFQNIERCIFNYSLKKSIELNVIPTWNVFFKNIYINKVRSIYTNLVSDNYVNNKRLLQRLKKKEFTPEQLVDMTPQEMFPENWKKIIDEKYRRDKILYETKKEAMTDQFKCSKCQSRETEYFEMQTRSADEPMTIFITCLNCGKRWKN